MKRPFAVVGITYLIAQTVAVLCGFAATAVLLCIALLCVPVLLILYKERPAWILPTVISCTICFGCNVGYSLAVVQPAQALEGQGVYVTGTICEAPVISYGRYYYVVETESVSLMSVPQKVRFRLSSGKDIDADYGDTIKTAVRFNYTDENDSTMRGLLADRVVLTAYLPYDSYPEIIDGGRTLYGIILNIRDSFSNAANRLMGEELGGLLVGMFTGDTSGISSVTLSRFRDCGLSHLFSVSGLHLSVLVAVLTVLLRRIVPNYRATALMTIPFVVFFMAFAGFSMSIRRAGIMTLLSLVAMIVKREADALNSLGIAAFGICLLNPYAAGDVGMLLSFASTFGLITLSWPVERKLRSAIRFDPKSRFAFILRPVLSSFSASIVAAMFTFPITVLCFGEISVLSPLANVLCIYPASAFMVIGAFASALFCLPIFGSTLGFIVFVPAWLFGRLTIALTKLLAVIPGAGLPMNYPFMPLFLVMAGLAVVVWYVLFGRKKQRLRSLTACAACIAVMFFSGFIVNNAVGTVDSSVMVFCADGGIMTALTSGKKCVIIGAGGEGYESWLASCRLAANNITNAVAVVLPDNTDRYAQSAVDVIEQYQPDTVLLSDSGRRFEMIEIACDELDAEMRPVGDAEYSVPREDIHIQTFTDDNDMLWVWAECRDLSLLICPEDGDCMLVPEKYAAPDVAVVTSDDIVNVTHIRPTALIISAVENEGKSAEAVLGYRGMKNIFSTDRDGCIVVTESGQGLLIDKQ